MATDLPSRPAEVIVDADSHAAESYAAAEFVDHYARSTGVILPTRNAPVHDGGRIFIGASAVDNSDAPSVAREDLGEEDLRIRAANDDVAIVGGSPRGTLYGVYDFLEHRLGVRFLAPDHTYVPALDDTELLAPMERTYRPPLEFRYSFYGIVQHDAEFAARCRINTVPEADRLGGRTSMRLINHTFTRWVRTDEFGADHPEYFALEDGVRRNDVERDQYETQPCMTNPNVRSLIIDGVRADLDAHPEWTNISVSQNDNRHYCRCPDCQAIIEREESPMGPLLELVNEVADVVAEEYPGVMVGTLAYQYSRAPPETMLPRENVQIQLCSIEACLFHPIDDRSCELNTDFCTDLAGWKELTDHIYIWNYNTNFRNYLLPCPNLRVIGPNVQYFVEQHAKGLFMQAAGGANVAEFDTLRNYLISNLLWDPTRDADELRTEFLELHFGPAGAPIDTWLRTLHDHVEAGGIHNNCFGDAIDFGLTDELVATGRECFEEALALAPDEHVFRRVERASLCIHRAMMEPAMLAMRERGPWNESLAEEMRPIVRRCYELADRYDVNIPVEHTDLETEKQRMGELFADDPTLFA